MFNKKQVFCAARQRGKTIVYPEACISEVIVQAAEKANKLKIAKVILLGDETALVLKYGKRLSGMTIINPKTSDLAQVLAEAFYNLRKDKGVTIEQAKEQMQNTIYFGTMLVKLGYADGMVGGAETSTSDILRPALQIIKAKVSGGIVSSCFLMCGKNKMLGKDQTMLLADCGLNVKPTEAEQLEIARQTVQTAQSIAKMQPRVAFLASSTKGSGKGEELEGIRRNAAKLKEEFPQLKIDGELQMDAAIVPRIAAKKCKNSDLKGDANVLIFPDLNAGNIAYKTMQYFGNVLAVGPILQGLAKPINDLSRGCTAEEIVLTTAITVLQAEDEPKTE